MEENAPGASQKAVRERLRQMPVGERLREWSDSLRPIDLDLIGDFAGKETGAVHGEALMLYCITTAQVDLSDGFQLVHAVHAVETFIHKLWERGSRFDILWFQDLAGLCLPAGADAYLVSKYLLARAVLIRHLQHPHGHTQDPSSPACLEFKGLQDPAFEAYLARQPIYFFLCMDGAAASMCSRETQVAYLSVAYHISSHGYSLAFVNDMVFVSSKARTSIVSPSTEWERMPLLVDPLVAQHGEQDLSKLAVKGHQAVPQGWLEWEDGRSRMAAREVTTLLALRYLATEHGSEFVTGSRWSAILLVQLALLSQLPLAQRSLSVVPLSDEPGMATFMEGFYNACRLSLEDSVLDPSLKWDLFDLVDGRLLRLVSSIAALPASALSRANQFAEKLRQITDMDVTSPPVAGLSALRIEDGGGDTVKGERAEEETAPSYGVLPFTQPVVDEFLRDIVLVPSHPGKESQPKLHQELLHWHSTRALVDTRRPPKPKTWRQRRADQRQMADTIVYSASLTNAAGKMIDPEIIVVKADSDRTNESRSGGAATAGPGRGGQPTGGGRGGKQGALAAARAVRDTKAKKKADDALVIWEKKCKELEEELDMVQKYAKATKYYSQLVGEPKAAIGAEVLLYRCNILAIILARPDGPKEIQQSKRQILGLLWSTMHQIDQTRLSRAGHKLFVALAKHIDPSMIVSTEDTTAPQRPLPYLAIPHGRAEMRAANLRLVDINFQLEHCGPLLERSFDPRPDPRVPFQPDAWQRKVLDGIDSNKKSLLVLAPTSSGKTFISFYAMRQILEASDEGVLVYVAPTKALVNQVAAEVQARFSKSFPLGGKSVWAIHTLDYRINNPMGCQVLITVPDVLQILLLSPTNAATPTSWSRRVRRIIFDEVHCIGQADDGVVWEQLLIMAPCPIIALSATVGNPADFVAWLRGLETAKGHEFEVITHETRYSDLRKFRWKPPTQSLVFSGFDPVSRLPVPGLDDGGAAASRFVFMHPVASLVNRNRDNLDDLSLEPRDCLSLWASMNKLQNDRFPLDPSLNPKTALPNPAKKADVAVYAQKLKTALQAWMKDGSSPFGAASDELVYGSCESELGHQELKQNALALLTDLRSQGALPALLFNYDRYGCEDIAGAVLNGLKSAEQRWQASSAEWKKKVAKFELWQKTASKLQKMQTKKTAKTKSKQGHDADNDGAADDTRHEEASSWESFDPTAPVPAFSFADETKLTSLELAETVRQLEYKSVDPGLIAALRRGVGVHHAGMARKYRQAVEILFRKGFLTVVVSTGTLALGINMPCPTVVFMGHSAYLTALNYHQASGRAGRRGFDLLGNVVFAGISDHQAREIMSARLPDLRGHFPLSTTLVLRVLGLLHRSDNQNAGDSFAVGTVKSLLSQTRLYLGGPSARASVLHHLRFSIEYLRRQHLLSEHGAPINLAGLVGHLYFTDRAVFAFHYLLKEGYFHSLLEEYRRAPDRVLLQIVLVLSHIFCRVPTKPNYDHAKAPPSTSVVLLPPLPEEALQILRAHNRDALDIFATYARTFIKQHLADIPDRSLPFTGFEVGGPATETTEASAGSSSSSSSSEGESLFRHAAGGTYLSPTVVRSPFTALSGHTDAGIASIHDLCETVRAGVFLDETTIPCITLYPDDETRPWNAYIYDFYRHGELHTLVRDNHILKGDVWFFLKDFSLMLATVVASLTSFVRPSTDAEGGDGDLMMMDMMDGGERGDANSAGQGGEDEEEKDETGSATDRGKSISGSTAVSGASFAKKAGKAKKKKVLDSWDDDSDSDGKDKTSGGGLDNGRSDSRASGAVSDGGGSSSRATAWEGADGEGLTGVLGMFTKVQEIFDEKFFKVWA